MGIKAISNKNLLYFSQYHKFLWILLKTMNKNILYFKFEIVLKFFEDICKILLEQQNFWFSFNNIGEAWICPAKDSLIIKNPFGFKMFEAYIFCKKSSSCEMSRYEIP